VTNMVQTHIGRWDTIQDWTLSVHAAPSLGRRDRDAGTALRDLAVDGFRRRQGLNNTGLAGKDSGIEVREESRTAAGGVIGTRQSESPHEKLRLKAERQVDHSSPVARQGSHSSLVGRTSERHYQLHKAHQGAQDMEAVQVQM
jgi:hypothetical protein